MKRLHVLMLLIFLAAVPGASADDDLAKIKEQELEEVRERISDLKQSMDRAARERDRLSTELQEADVGIALQRRRLAALEREHALAEARRVELGQEIQRREAELDGEMAELAEQVRAAYVGGEQERLRLLLNQRDPATLGRLMVYYGYLNDYRSDNINTVAAALRELAALHSGVAAEEARLGGIANEQRSELAALDNAQQRRRELITRLREQLSSEGKEVERLAAQEQDLARLIDELTSILSDYPISSEDPFDAHKGRLTWPVAGTLVNAFGQPRAGGQLRWNGVVLGAPRGREVRAIYHGRVAYADWLAGMGLMVIVDHGDGYMTLYGYNETILKDTGDWVAPGDVIATVGDSGGQSSPALYFEIRHRKRPVDPAQWVTRRPGESGR